MPLNFDDPRVKKTRRGLREAFVRLILRTGYDAISIQDIADEAQTARVTFYRHYRDKEELLIDCLNMLYEELVERTTHLKPGDLRDGRTPVMVFYQHIEEQEDLYRILFSSRGTQVVIRQMQHLLANHAEASIKAVLNLAHLQAPLEIITQHAAGAQISLAMWWLEQGKPYPAPYMAQVATWLSIVGLRHAFGLGHLEMPPPPTIKRP